MAQLISKASTLELAKTLALRNPEIRSKTAHELEALKWDGQQIILQTCVDAAWIVLMNEGGVDGKHKDAFSEVYMASARSVWSAQIAQLTVQRNAFRHLSTNSIDLDLASTKIRQLVESFHLRGMVPLGDATFGLTVRVQRGPEEANLYFRFTRDTSTEVSNPDIMGQRVGMYTMETELSWSSTQRTIERAVTAATMYRELAEMAAEVVATMAQERIVWKRGF